jgi:hypothetical protein
MDLKNCSKTKNNLDYKIQANPKSITNKEGTQDQLCHNLIKIKETALVET